MLYKKRIILNSTHCTNAILSPSKVHDCAYVMYCSTHTYACHGERWFKCTHRYTQKKLWASFNKKERQQRQPCIVHRDRTEAAAAWNTTVFIWSAGKRGFVARRFRRDEKRKDVRSLGSVALCRREIEVFSVKRVEFVQSQPCLMFLNCISNVLPV